MKVSIRMMAAFLICVLAALAGCTSSPDKKESEPDPVYEESAVTETAEEESETSEEKKEEISEESAQTEDQKEEEEEEQISAEEETENIPVYIDYVDAWGEYHTMEVDPSVKANPYTDGSFVNDPSDPQRITYEDDKYEVLQGVDVSEHQGVIDWEQVASSGYSFAFIRVGYRGYGQAGVLMEDVYARDNLKKAKEAGLLVGAYFFSQAITEEEAREEALLAAHVIKDSGITLDLPVVYDPEITKNDAGRANNITKEQVTLNTEAFCSTIKEELSWDADIYSNLPWEHELFEAKVLNSYKIWYADYEPVPQTPYHFTWWQYTNEGSVPGIDGPADIDMWLVERE